MSDALPDSSPPSSPPRRVVRIGLRVTTALLLVVAGWVMVNFGARLWSESQTFTTSRREAGDTAPIGYIGTAFRRTYYNRPAQFLHQEDGRTYLFALRDEDETEYYDVTDAEMNVPSLSGGYGRDSNPGIDYPI